MKKIMITSLVAMFSFLTVMPALASETGVADSAENLQLREKIQQEIKNNPKVRVGKAVLVEIKGDNLPTELVVKIDKKIISSADDVIGAKSLEAEKLYTVKVDNYTHFVRKYWGKSSLQELTVGDKLFLVVLDYGNGNYQALLVKDNSIFWRMVAGKVADINYNDKTFVLLHGNKKLKVQATNKTKYMVPGVLNPDFDDLKEGQRVRAHGVVNSRLQSMDLRFARVMKPWPVLKAMDNKIDAVKI
ncbi:MAG: hypothetical protein ABIH87_04850 [bacterium]